MRLPERPVHSMSRRFTAGPRSTFPSRRALTAFVVGSTLALGGCGLVLDWSGYEDGGSGEGGSGGSGGSSGVVTAASGGGNCEVACPEGEVCEAVEDGSFGCFEPVMATVVVTTYPGVANGAKLPVSGARVLFVAEGNHRALTLKASEEPGGLYRAQIPAERNATTGRPLKGFVHVVVEASEFLPYPSWIQPPSRANLLTTTQQGEIQFPEVTLQRPTEVRQGGMVSGNVAKSGAAGAIVVALLADGGASAGKPAVGMSIADAEGNYVLRDLPAENLLLKAYATGLTVDDLTVTAPPGDGIVLNFTESDAPTFRVNSFLVGAPNVAQVVALVPTSILQPAALVGPVPPGMQLIVTGDESFRFERVPQGEYAIVTYPFDDDDSAPVPGNGVPTVAVKDKNVNLAEGVGLASDWDLLFPTTSVDTLSKGSPMFPLYFEASAASCDAYLFGANGELLEKKAFSETDITSPMWTAEKLNVGQSYSYVIHQRNTDGHLFTMSELYKGQFRVVE
ncbi:carboxypeptidase-like regulatory domain-containing protein [Chondromyces apiculatus]|nr:carboxypeptidase-like regulatory domain-containing protein [Chondromyces apiculatus]